MAGSIGAGNSPIQAAAAEAADAQRKAAAKASVAETGFSDKLSRLKTSFEGVTNPAGNPLTEGLKRGSDNLLSRPSDLRGW